MTPYTDIYGPFMGKMLEDEWALWDEAEVLEDQRSLLESAIVWVKFPRQELTRDDTGFMETLDTDTIQLIATYMKCEWLDRAVLTWENIKPMYAEKDFSQANLLGRLSDLLDREEKKAAKLQSIYCRMINGKPFDYSRLAGA